MANRSDFDGVVIFRIKEHTVVTAAETEASERRFQLFHITGTTGEVAIQAIENLHGCFAVDGAKIDASLRQTDDRNASGSWLRISTGQDCGDGGADGRPAATAEQPKRSWDVS